MDRNLAEAILETLKQRLGERKFVCGLCGGTRWKTSDVVNLPVQDSLGGGMVIGGKAMPLFGLICEVCGNTNFINIITLLGKEKIEQLRQQKTADKILKEALGSSEEG